MKFICDTKELATALRLAANVAPKEGYAPILSCVLLEVGGGSLSASAFDGGTGLTQALPVRDTQPGKVAVPAKRLADIVGCLAEETVGIRLSKDGHLEIKSGSAKFSIACHSGDQYPALPVPSKDSTDTLPADILSSALGSVAYAMSASEAQYILQAVHLSMGQQIVWRATDGHRLAQVTTMGRVSESTQTAVLPRKGVQDLMRLVDSGSVTDSWDIAISATVATFSGPSQTLTMSLLSGEYPDTSKVMPPPGKSPALLERKALLEALRRVAHVSSGLVDFRLGENRLTLLAVDAEIGDATETLPAKYTGSSTSIGLNNKYIQQALEAVDTEQVILDIQGPSKPVRIGQEDDSCIAVVMPMRSVKSDEVTGSVRTSRVRGTDND